MHDQLGERLRARAERIPVPAEDLNEVLTSGRRRLFLRRMVAVAGVATLAALAVVFVRADVFEDLFEGKRQPPAERSERQQPPEPSTGTFADVHGWIAFRRGSEIMAVDPANPTNTLALGPSFGDDPIAWSSDGTKLLLRSEDEEERLFVLHSDGSRTTLLPERFGENEPTWARPTWGSFSPDGTEVVYGAQRSPGPYIIDADGGEPRLLGGDRCHVEVNGLVVDTCGEGADAAAWAPDGSKILWSDFIEGGGRTKPYGEDCPIRDCGHRAVLSSVNPDGTDLELGVAPLPGEGLGEVGLVWSPEGSRLAFFLTDNDDLNGQVFVINPDGSGLRQITHGGDNRWPTWSPDGSRVAFVRDGTLYTMAPDGTDMQVLQGVTADGAIAWNPAE